VKTRFARKQIAGFLSGADAGLLVNELCRRCGFAFSCGPVSGKLRGSQELL